MPNSNTVRYTAQEEFPDLTQHNNFLSRVLTVDLYKKLRSVQTVSGFTINDVIQTGVDNPGDLTAVGCVAGDEESYKVFADFFDPIIESKHNCFKKTDSHKSDIDPSHLKGSTNLDQKYALSTRIEAGRNIRGICLLPHCSRAERRLVVKVACEALAKLNGNMKGKYFPLKDMPNEHLEQLVADHLLFDKPISPLELSSGLGRDWPDARGIWHNDGKNFLVWMNEKDHLRIISVQNDGNIHEGFERWCTGLQLMEKLMNENKVEFMSNPHLGYIATCPSDLGTSLSVSVRLKIPRTSKTSKFDEALQKLRLQKKEIDCTDSTFVNGIFDISNVDRIGFTEVELIQMVVDGVGFLIDCEKSLERGGNIDVELASLKQK